MMSVKDDLIAAKMLIDTPDKWTKGRYFREGLLCAQSALTTATRGVGYQDAELALRRAVPVLFSCGNELPALERYNDAQFTMHADIMALFDRAIAAQEKV